MKKLFLIVFTITFLVTAAIAAHADESITKGNLWADIQLQSRLHESGIGIAARFNTRFNFNYAHDVNGNEIDTDSQNWYLQDFYFGLMWTRVFFDKLTFVVSPQYRFEAWHADNAKSQNEKFFRHAIYWPFLFKYDFGKVILKYQVLLWNTFKVKDQNQDDEFYLRNLIGVIIPVSKLIDIFIEDEIYVLTTADSGDGQDPFYRNAVWAGATFKPLDFLSVKVAYVNYYTLLSDTSAGKVEQFDHFIYAGVVFNVDLAKDSTPGEAIAE